MKTIEEYWEKLGYCRYDRLNEVPKYLRNYDSTFKEYLIEELILGEKYLASILEGEGPLKEEQEKAIRTYFNVRWQVLKGQSLIYTSYPSSPLNSLCLQIAKSIAKENEPICQILMPSITGLVRDCYSLKAETEEDTFLMHKYLVNEDSTKLIPVEEIFRTISVNTNYVFREFQPPLTALPYSLSEEEFSRVTNFLGDVSRNYINKAKQVHKHRYAILSFGNKLRKLALALRGGSIKGFGTEDKANYEVISNDILNFFNFWREQPKYLSISCDGTDIRVNDLLLRHYGRALTLKSYLLAVFFQDSRCQLTEEENACVIQDKIFPCADQIANCLLEFLTQYPELYDISTNNDDNELGTELSNMLPNALDALKNRPPISIETSIRLTHILSLLDKLPKTSFNTFDYLSPLITTQNNFLELSNFPDLLIGVIEFKLEKNDKTVNNIDVSQVLGKLDEEKQMRLIDIYFTKFCDAYNDENKTKWQKIEGYLKPACFVYFLQRYSKVISKAILTFTQLKSAKRSYCEMVLGLILVEKCKTNPDWFYNFDDFSFFKECFCLLSLKNKKFIYNSCVKPKLSTLINPDSYSIFNSIFDKEALNEDMAKFLVKACENLMGMNKLYSLWADCPELLAKLTKAFCDKFNSDLSNNVRLVFDMTKFLNTNDGYYLLKRHSNSINSMSLVKEALFRLENRYNELLQSSVISGPTVPSRDESIKLQRELFDSLNLISIVTSIDSLKEILTLCLCDKNRRYLYHRFSAGRLNCSPESFKSALAYKDEYNSLHTLALKFNPVRASEKLSSYNSYSDRYTELVSKLKIIFNSKKCDPLDMLVELFEAIEQLSNEYRPFPFFYPNPGYGKLYELLTQILAGNYEYSNPRAGYQEYNYGHRMSID